MSGKKEKKTWWKNSIRTQLALVFILLLTAEVGLAVFINTVLLQRYYISNKKKEMVASYEMVNRLADEFGPDSDSFKSDADRLTSDRSLLVVIADSGMNILYSTERESEMIASRLLWRVISGDPSNEPGNESADEKTGSGPGEAKGDKAPSWEKDEVLAKTDNYMITKSTDPAMKSDFIELWGYMHNRDLVFIRTPLESIRESASISARFMMYVAIVIAVCGAVIIWLISKRITDPVLELTGLSDRMAHMDFDARYKSGGENEIGELGRHMNEMSEQLEKAIADLKSANNELQKDIDRKEKIENMRSEFISNVSHELKTPISLITGYAEGLRDGIADDEETRNEYLEVIIDESEKMHKLVSNLLELNHIEFGNDPVEMSRFDVTELIAGVIDSSRVMAKQFQVSVGFERKDPVYVWSDEYKTEIVFTNYLTNAIHYAGGDKKIEVTVVDSDQNVRIQVFNTGDRIPEEAVDRIWEKFYKVDKARSREVGGSGVGLSIVKAVMETLNKPCGVINYDEGVGFWFELEKAGTTEDTETE
ncbi:MAG: HAMP domain-containing histidine kinase [Lachnospiraceae bacterium]|nr:HAMP domain-containing histidine kinase [Lachnospiraceae bacterium]